MCLLAVYVPQDSGEDFRLVGCGSVLSGKSVPSHGTGLQPLCFLDLRNRIHILNRSVGKKYPVTLVQIFRHTSTEGRMLHYVLTALGIILFLVVAVFRAVFSYNWTWLCRRADCKKIDKIPGPKPIPFFGNMFLFILPEEELSKLFLRLYKEYAPTFRLWVMGFPEVFITDPEDVESLAGQVTCKLRLSAGDLEQHQSHYKEFRLRFASSLAGNRSAHQCWQVNLLKAAILNPLQAVQSIGPVGERSLGRPRGRWDKLKVGYNENVRLLAGLQQAQALMTGCNGLRGSYKESNKWQGRRKFLTPAFHFKILEEYLKVFNTNSQILVEKLGAQVGESFVDITSYVSMCTLDLICETAMGVQIHSQTDGEAEYIKAVKRMAKVVVKRQFTPWLHKDCIYYSSPLGREELRLLQILHGFSDQVMSRGALCVSGYSFDLSKRRRLAFLDLLIEISEQEGLLSGADIREEVDTFMFEGHDTTSMGISWAMYLLGSHPEVQEKVVEELKGIFGDSDREATYGDLQQMKYLERVIKEALRLFPSVPAFSRCLEVDVKIKNYTIPAGTQLPILPFLMHRNPEVFPNPEDFNPDNFLPERVQNRHPFAYIPFSAGPRNCIGQRFAMLEEKVVLSSVLRRLRLESLDKREEVPLLLELILRPQNGIRIKISPR
ncbi:hypothetical protein Cfor_12948 [Coptotermes formosanus]|uniref:Cytochrome P450 n=1 Tax=Coptotermes formosanus TaxID=36987 RepID=A0A6L2PIV0_COPFO|nr:hypothetical protein Cfor_12948 [Coptotermes formosanus]